MKSGWAIKKLGEVCELIADGDWIESKDQSTSGIRLVQTGNVGVGIFRNKEGNEHFISSETFKRLNCTEIFGGDILISRLPDPVGRACVVPDLGQKMITAVDCSIVRLRPSVCLPAFLVYYASSSEWFNTIEAKCTGSTRKRISRKNLTDVLVPVPPLPEQKRIVAKIDAAFEKIDKLKANAERNLANAKELFQSALDEAMRQKKGWVEKRLGEVCDSVLGKMLDRMKNRGRPEKYLRNVNVRWGSFDLSNLIEMGFEEDEQERFGLRHGDLVMCEGGEPGRCAVWPGVPAKMKFQKALHRIRCPKELNPYFLYYQFRAQAGAGVLQKYFDGRDATIKHLTGKLLKTVLLFIPSLAEQKEIVKRLDALAAKTDLLEQHYTRQIADCVEMRQSVLREAFEGRL